MIDKLKFLFISERKSFAAQPIVSIQTVGRPQWSARNYAVQAKTARAEPVAALYEQGRVSHVGSFPELEDEMCSVIGEGAGSPDRLDALVWAIHDLMLRRRVEPRVRVGVRSRLLPMLRGPRAAGTSA